MGFINTLSSVKADTTIRECVKHKKRVEGRILGNQIHLRCQQMKKEAEKEGLVAKKKPRGWGCFQGTNSRDGRKAK